MAHGSQGRACRVFWLAAAGVALATAGLLSPARVLAQLDGPAERFRDDLAAGIGLVRIGLIGAALLALASFAWWRRSSLDSEHDDTNRALARVDFVIAFGLFLVAAVLAAPNLDGSFWWDELTSLSLVVKRGPPVILAYSCKANNHILNSLGMWLAWRVFGESEAALRLPALLLGAAVAPTIYLTLTRRGGRDVATIAGLLAAVHPAITCHSVEARGYAGAILCSYLACACFASLLRRPRTAMAFLYVAAALAAVGFLTTTILVPVAHGVIALVLAVRGSAASRTNARHAIFACLWVGVLGLVLFGLPLPQTWHYARTEGTRDHLPLGLPLLESSACYLAGTSMHFPALLLLAASAWGWAKPRQDVCDSFSFLGPVIAALAWMLLPGTHLSARFLCFLIPAIAIGLAFVLARLARGGRFARVSLVGVAAVWLVVTLQSHLCWQTLGNPDLKGLARRLRGQTISLAGSQADVNRHYFPHASVVEQPRELREMPAVDYVIQGKVGFTEPDPRLASLGFAFLDRLDSAVPGRTVYFVYRRAQSQARRP